MNKIFKNNWLKMAYFHSTSQLPCLHGIKSGAHSLLCRSVFFLQGTGDDTFFFRKIRGLAPPFFFFHLNISILYYCSILSDCRIEYHSSLLKSFINPAADMLDRGQEAHHLIGRASGRPKMDALSCR